MFIHVCRYIQHTLSRYTQTHSPGTYSATKLRDHIYCMKARLGLFSALQNCTPRWLRVEGVGLWGIQHCTFLRGYSLYLKKGSSAATLWGCGFGAQAGKESWWHQRVLQITLLMSLEGKHLFVHMRMCIHLHAHTCICMYVVMHVCTERKIYR